MDRINRRYTLAVSIRYMSNTNNTKLIRFTDPTLKAKLTKLAKKQRWSLNTFINSILEDHVIMSGSRKEQASHYTNIKP